MSAEDGRGVRYGPARHGAVVYAFRYAYSGGRGFRTNATPADQDRETIRRGRLSRIRVPRDRSVYRTVVNTRIPA